MRFFLDNCISVAMSRAIAELARAQGIEVIHLSDRFPRNTTDVEWIRALREEQWIIVSGDTRISRNPAERAAWLESRLTAFFFEESWSRRRFWVQASELVRWWPVLLETAGTCTRGSGYLLPFKGNTPRLIYGPKERQR
ncbi:MAG: hypothetical protein ACREOJ_00055 [Gemmatimonadaceae bacterium]